MIAPQTFNNYPEFGVAAVKCCPDAAKYANGYIQGDVLPAEHLNWFLSGATVGVSALQLGMDSLEKEMQTLLTCAGQSPQAACFDQIYNAIMYQINACVSTAAPKAHASSANTYGVGNADCYGHLKISDTYTSTLAACAGVAASQMALSCVYQTVLACKTQLGVTVGCALGTASAGTANTAARSDHVHPIPTVINCSKLLCQSYFCSAGNHPLAISSRDQSTGDWQYATVGVSLNCKITFNPATGVVTTNIFCGSLCGNATSALNAECLGSRTPAQYIRNCNGVDLGVDANLGTYHTMTTKGPNGCWNHLLNLGWSECASTDYYAAQFSIPSVQSTARMSYRKKDANTLTWGSWIDLLDTSGGQTINGSLTATAFCGVADCSKLLCQTYYCSADEIPIALTTRSLTAQWEYATVGASANCKISFNPATGVLKAKCFCGTASCATCASDARYADSSCYSCYAGLHTLKTSSSPSYPAQRDSSCATRIVVLANSGILLYTANVSPQCVTNTGRFIPQGNFYVLNANEDYYYQVVTKID